MNLVSWLNRGIRYSFYLLLVLVPIILTPVNYELFEYNKMMVTYALSAVIMGLWLTKMVSTRQFSVAKTPLDLPIILFVASQLISSIFSWDPHVSWFGYYSRFNGGMWSVFCYVFLYYAFVSNFLPAWRAEDEKNSEPVMADTARQPLHSLLRVMIAAGVAVALYGVAERMGIDKHLWVQDVQTRVFSTLGQPNWLAAYLVALIPLPIVLALQAPQGDGIKNVRFNLFLRWSGVTLLYFVVLLFTRSRSGLAGLAVADGVLISLISNRFGKNTIHLKHLAILHVALLVVVIINGSNIAALDKYISLQSWKDRFAAKQEQVQVTNNPDQAAGGTVLDTGGTESGTIRKYVWQGAISAWQSSLKTQLIGTGTETFAYAFFKYKPVEHNATSEWDFLYNKAHNEYLNYLTTTGIIGLGSYLILIFAILFMMVSSHVRQLKHEERNDYLLFVSAALIAGFGSILVTNFFGFSVVIIQIFFFLFPAFHYVLSAYGQGHQKNVKYLSFPVTISKRMAAVISFFIVLLVGYIIYCLAISWEADRLFALGYRLSRAGKITESVENLTRAVDINPREPFYHDELGVALSALATQQIDSQNATEGASFAQSAVRHSDIALTLSPNNVNFWKSRTKIFYAFSNYDPQYNQLAIQSLENAYKLSPTDPKIAYNLAVLYGRSGDNQKAIEILKNAIPLKKDYRDTYFALHIFYIENKQTELAKQILQLYLSTVNPDDADFLERVKQLESK